MSSNNNVSQPLFTSYKQVCLDLGYIFLGSFLYAITINGILVPHHFVNGGITGISLIIHTKFSAISVGWIYLMLNIPIFALSWMAVGRRFFFYSLVGSLSLSLAIAYVHISVPLEDKMLNALLAGVLGGTGAGISLRSSGSQGGLDILSVFLLKRFSVSIGTTVLAMNSLVMVLTGMFYSLEAVLYTMIVLFVSSKVINLVITGLSQRKAVMIVSTEWKTISKEILKDIRRGITLFRGEGGYGGGEEKIIYTVVHFRDIGTLKRLVQRIDPNAFVVISDTLEVMNYRIGNQPHW